jgi:hypothetical protein
MSAPDFPHATTAVLAEGTPRAPAASSPGTAFITRDRPGVVRVAVDARAPCHLVLADTFFPGWRVTVDGEPREIARANVAFRAVALEPGGHMVDFTYEPLWFRVGAWASGAAALLTALLLVLGPRRERAP